MARNLYPGTFVQLSSGAPGPNMAVTIWSDLTAGTNVTAQLLGADGTSAYTATTDGNGNLQPFRGPDGYSGMLFVDSNVGIRYELLSPTAWDNLQTTVAALVATPPGGGITDHGALSGLADDDHPQYHNDTRGDARYYTKAQDDANLSSAVSASSTGDRNRANHSGTQAASSISDFAAAVAAVPGFGGGSGSSAVTSVAGRTGAVVVTKSDVALGLVDNTADVNKPVSTAQASAIAAKAPLASPTFTGTVTLPTPGTGANEAATRAFVLANVGSGTAGVTTDAASTSTSLAPSAVTARTMIGKQGPVKQLTAYASAGSYGALQTVLDSDSSTISAAKLTNNDAILAAANADAVASGGVVTGPDDYFPFSTVLTGSAAIDGLNVIHQKGDTTGGGTRTVKPAITVRNLYGTPQVLASVGQMQVGPSLSASSLPFAIMGLAVLPTLGSTGIDAQGGYRTYKAGQVGQMSCKDWFNWSVETGLHDGSNPEVGVNRAEELQVAGIVVNVSSVNLTGAGTVGAGLPTGTLTLERHQIRGATSNRTALANAWAADSGGTTGKLLFGSVPGDFYIGENLVDVASGNVIGVAGTMGLAFNFRCEHDYNRHARMTAANTTTPGTYTQSQIDAYKPRFALIDMTADVQLKNIKVKFSHDVDAFAVSADRNSAQIQVDGSYKPQIQMQTSSSASRALLLRSCWLPVVDAPSMTAGTNHALSLSNPNVEEGYTYGVELRGTTYGAQVRIVGSGWRHLVTTNPATKTWEASTDSHLDYGTVMDCTVHDSLASDTWGAGFDTHEGAIRTRFINCQVLRSNPGGRILTTSVGFNNRGFGTYYENCHVRGGAGGFSSGGEALTAGFKHRITYKGCTTSDFWGSGFTSSDFLSGGVNNDATTNTGWFATIEYNNCVASGDISITTTIKEQIGFQCSSGRYEWVGMNIIRGVNSSHIRQDAGGSHEWFNAPLFDCRVGSNTPVPIRSNGTQLTPNKFHEKCKVIRRSPTVPASLFRNAGGDTVWIHPGDASTSTLTDVTASQDTTRLPMFANTVGTPVYVDTTAPVINTRTASYTLTAGDAGDIVEMNVASANTLTVPAGVFSAGDIVWGRQYGAGLTTMVAGSGLTLPSRGGALASAGRYAEWTITFRSATEAVLSGDIA